MSTSVAKEKRKDKRPHKEMSSTKKTPKLQLEKGKSLDTGLSKNTKASKNILTVRNLKDLIKRLSTKKVVSIEMLPKEPQDIHITLTKKKHYPIPKKVKSPAKLGKEDQKIVTHESTNDIDSDERRQAEKAFKEKECIFKEDVIDHKPTIQKHESIITVLGGRGFVSKTLAKGQSAGREIIGDARVLDWMKEEPEQQPIQEVEKVIEGGDVDKGYLHYALSDLKYIDNGITQLPTDKIVKKMNIYRMSFVKPELNWFNRNSYKRLVLYKTGERLGEINEDDTGGKWYYKNGDIALDYIKIKDPESDVVNYTRYVVYSRSEEDLSRNKKPITVLACFDDQGNGIVFDHVGKARLKYNQSEGVLLDTTLGPETHWLWHSLNEPPVLQHVMVDTELLIKDPIISTFDVNDEPASTRGPSKDESLLAIEHENFMKEKTNTSKPYVPFKIRMKALKINDYFSLRIIQQSCIDLSFKDGNTNLKLNLGMVLDNTEIIDVKTSDLDDVWNPVDCLPAASESIAELQAHLFEVKAKERIRVKRQDSLRPKFVFSTDRFEPHITHPLRKGGRSKSRSMTCICTCNELTKNAESYYLM